MESIDCIICNSSTSSIFNDSLHSDYNIVKCKCGFIYLNPRPNSLDITRYYAKEYLPHNTHNSKIYTFLQILSFKWKYKIIKKLFPNKGIHLDVGSGNNNFSNYLRSKGWKSQSYDKFSHSNINNLKKIENNSIDLITMWHSIEHMHDINDVIKYLFNKIKDNGYLLIACPNIDAFERNLFKNNWVAYDVPRHLYHFNHITLSNYLKKSGFIVNNHYPIYQDTFFNIFLSFKYILSKIFLYLPYLIISLCYMLLMKKQHSSYLYICKKYI